jgi:hypothetical protein
VSLIDEALKRAQAAHQDAAKEGAPAPPWTPAPLPDRRRARLPYVLAGVLLVAFIAAALLVIRRWPSAGKTQTAAEPHSSPAAATPSRSGSAESTLPAIVSEVIVEPPPREASEEPRKTPPADTPKATPLPPAAIVPGAATAPERPARAPADGRTYFGQVPLPGGGKIELGGIVFSEESPTALVNGRVVRSGSFVEGYEVTRILPDRVELTGNGTTIFVVVK